MRAGLLRPNRLVDMTDNKLMVLIVVSGGGLRAGQQNVLEVCGDELPQRDGGRECPVGQPRASERAGVVRAQPAEDLAPLVRVPVGGGDGVLHHLLADRAEVLGGHLE